MNYYDRQEAAAKSVQSLLSLPLPVTREDCGADGFFDPWNLFPFLYGSYSSDFDAVAIKVLENLRDEAFEDESLPHEMFREMLCTAALCDYGSSPRVCFATSEFKSLLPQLIEAWKTYSKVWWAP